MWWIAVALAAPLTLTVDGEVLGTPAPAGLERYCEGRVYPVSGMHLSWEAGTLPFPPEEVRPAMKALLGEGWVAEDEGFRRAEPGMERFLDVVGVNEPGPHEQCRKQRPKNARSVLMYVLVPREGQAISPVEPSPTPTPASPVVPAPATESSTPLPIPAPPDDPKKEE